MLEIDDVMSKLAQERPVFHSEADFQHAFAWCIHTTNPDLRVRLEYKPFPHESKYLDLWFSEIESGQTNFHVAVELKYYTRKLEVEHNGEWFALRDGQAHPPHRYDFLKDIQRLEKVHKERREVRAGIAVLLTNDHLYWQPPLRTNIVDANFRIHAGRQVTGVMDWSKGAADGTKKNREESICLSGSYEFKWQEYANFGGGCHGKFRYLAVRVFC